mgnify:CR=1 FL=1
MLPLADLGGWCPACICPITQELPIDPVTAEDGRVYERSAITQWLSTNNKSPHTNELMGSKLIPAMQVKNLIASMVRSGAISGDKADKWKARLEQEEEIKEVRRRAEAGDAVCLGILGTKNYFGDEGLPQERRVVRGAQAAQGAPWCDICLEATP